MGQTVLHGLDALKNWNKKSEEKPAEKSEEKKPALPEKPYNQKLATAPYNFVDLPTDILASPLDAYRDVFLSGDQKAIRKAFREYLEKSEGGTHDGYIDLDVESLTPIFIGGSISSFAPAGKPIIPGSTIRGMVKNLFKIGTLGAMRAEEDFHDRHLYFRCIMAQNNAAKWQEELHELYKGQMTDGTKSKTKSGFLIRTKEGWFICPMKESRTSERCLIAEFEARTGNIVDPGMKDVRVFWDENAAIAYAISGKTKGDVYFENWDQYNDYKEETKRIAEKNASAADVRRRKVGKQFVLQYPLAEVDWDVARRIPVDEGVVQEYRDDKNRRGVNLLKLCSNVGKRKGGSIDDKRLQEIFPEAPKDIEIIAPCCYLPDEQSGVVRSFGHGHYFRVAYPFPISNAVKTELRDQPTIDFADALFGATLRKKESLGMRQKPLWASRVFFEDAHAVGNVKAANKSERTHPLVGPNPTSYQLYLKQPQGVETGDTDTLTTWGSPDAEIRGYKLYWHRPKASWIASKEEKDQDKGKKPEEQMTHEIMPLLEGNRFKARIRFCNLSDVELGALLSVFHPNGAAQLDCKLGHAKSLGFGSVRIKPTLFVENADKYAQLFGGDGWNKTVEANDGATYMEAFQKYVEGKGMDGEWRHINNGLLAKMLDWQNAVENPEQWNKNTSPMAGNVKTGDVNSRYKSRACLPEIGKMVKTKKTKDKEKRKKKS